MAFLESAAYGSALGKTADYRRNFLRAGWIVSTAILAVSLLCTDIGGASVKACLLALWGFVVWVAQLWHGASLALVPQKWALLTFTVVLSGIFMAFYSLRQQMLEHLVKEYAECPPTPEDGRGAVDWAHRNCTMFRYSAVFLVTVICMTASAFIAGWLTDLFIATVLGAGVFATFVSWWKWFFLPKSHLAGFSFAEDLLDLKVWEFIGSLTKYPTFHVLRNHLTGEAILAHRVHNVRSASFPEWAAAMHQAGLLDINAPSTAALLSATFEDITPAKENGPTKAEHEESVSHVLSTWRKALQAASTVAEPEAISEQPAQAAPGSQGD